MTHCPGRGREPIWNTMAVTALLALALAGCNGPAHPDWPYCTGDRTFFDGRAPGLHKSMSQNVHHPFLAISSEDAPAGLTVEGLMFPVNWTGASLLGLSWHLAPAKTVGQQDREVDYTEGFLALTQLEGQYLVTGELPIAWTDLQRNSTLDGFLANVTSSGPSERVTMLTQAAWFPGPFQALVPQTSPSNGEAPTTQDDRVPTAPAGRMGLHLKLPGPPHLSPMLGDGANWTEATHFYGIRQVFIGSYVLNVHLPVLTGFWEAGSTSVELTADADDWARITIYSSGHDRTMAEQIGNATAAALGWDGEANWRILHEDGTAPIESWMAPCPPIRTG